MSTPQSVITREGFDRIHKELQELKNVKRKEIATRIQEAKELGDLSENAEYAEAKNEQAFIEGRIAELENLMKTVSVIDSPTDTQVVHVGSSLEVRSDGKTFRYTIVGSNEADPSAGKISNQSPLGKAFVGHKVKDQVEVTTPRGLQLFEVISIE